MSRKLLTDEQFLQQLNMKRKRLTGIYRIVEKMQSRNAKLEEIDSRYEVLLRTKNTIYKDEDKIRSICRPIVQHSYVNMSASDLRQEIHDLDF